MITAVVLLPVFLVALFYSPDELWLGLIGMVTLIAWDEWLRLAGVESIGARLVGHAVLVLLGFVQYQVQVPVPVVTACALVVWGGLIVAGLILHSPVMDTRTVKLVSGCVVLLTTWWLLTWTRAQWMGDWWVLLCMCIVWLADIGAYFVGKAIGKTKLAPAISPGKTVEGVFGGLVTALAGGGVAAILILPIVPLGFIVPTILLTVLASVCGDLYESTLKRSAGVKDSGNLLPGHGGMLDRIDAILAALPVFTAGLLLAGLMDVDLALGG